MQLPVQTFESMLQRMAASLQGSAQSLVDLTVGSVLRACLEASATVALWLQWLILQVLTVTRAATSQGSDLDSWMADFSFTRLPGSTAAGTATFGRYTIGIATTIPVGALIKTTDGTVSFSVIAATSNPAWNGAGGYTLAASAASVDVPIAAIAPGSAGNVQAGSIGLLATSLPGVDYVANALALSGGADPESDAAFRTRFVQFINSRSLATPLAIGFAVSSTRQGLRYAILENQDLAGNLLEGHFCVIVDDGTGSPGADLLASVQQQVELVRPIGSTYSVTGPVVVPVAIQLGVIATGAASHSSIGAEVESAIAGWVAGLGFGATLALSRIDALAHGADLAVASVGNVSINGVQADLMAPASGVLILQSVSVN